MRKYIKKLISGMLALSMFTSTLITSSAATDVNVSVNVNPKIDIMLSSKETNVDLTNFETDIKNNLINKGVSTENIKFTKTKNNDSIPQDSFDWEENTNISKILTSIQKGPNYIYMKGNQGSTRDQVGQGVFVYFPEETSYAETITFDYDMNFGDSFTGGGVILKAYKENNILHCYGISINTTSTNWGTNAENTKAVWMYLNSGKKTGALWKMTIDMSTHSLGTYELIQGFNLAKKGTITAEVTRDQIKISGGGMTTPITASVASNFYNASGIGYFGVTYYHGCSSIGQFNLTNIHLNQEVYLAYKKILTQPTWREDAKHIVINVNDAIDETLTSSSTIGEILSRTLADDIHFIQWGTNTNKSASETFISRNDNKGLFIDNSNYNNAVDQTTDYIISLIEQESSEQYITVGQDISFSVDPEEYKTGATSTDYPNGRWKINHEYKYFANNQGQSAESGVPTPDLNFNFDKPGKYNILFDDKLVKEIYVHRKPVADFTIEIGENNSLILNSLSYDLDSNENKGIAKETWYYKEASASTWTEGKLTEFDKTKIYMIKLEVEDYQGATSYTTKYTGTGNPVSNFNYVNNVVSKYKPLVVNNTSYDPEGYEIVEQNWVLKKDGVVVSESSEPVTNFNVDGLGEGNYTYTLTVKNNLGTVSEAFTKSFTIEEDYGKPEVAIGQQGCDWKHSQAVSLEFSDNESEFKNWRYAFTTSPVAPATDEEWSDWSEEVNSTVQIADVSGKYYLHIQAYDIASNELTRAVGTYNLDNTDPIINDVKTQKDEINKTFIKVEATDEHSGIVGYAITKAEPMTFNLRARTAVAIPTEFQESNILEVTDNGTYNVWTKDAAGNITSTVYTIEDVNYIGKNTTVYAEVGSAFKVTIPKHIILSGTTKSGAYTVAVEGDIAGTDKIKVIPDESFALKSTNLNDVTATITQDKTEWSYDQILNNEFKVIGNGSIDAKDISAGSWNGNFNFNIALEGDKVYKNSEPFVEYIDILYNYETSENN